MNKSRSKAPGESSVVEEKTPSDMQSSSEEPRPNISDMSGSSPNQTSQIGFQPTKALGELDKETTNARLVTTFAAELGALVEWRKLTLVDGREVFALCFPVGSWKISPNGELRPVRSVRNDG